MSSTLEFEDEGSSAVSKNGKRTLPPSRKEVDAKFAARGVNPQMIRDGTGVDRLELAKMRALLTTFEEAHQNGCDIARGAWPDIVGFYLKHFSLELRYTRPSRSRASI